MAASSIDQKFKWQTFKRQNISQNLKESLINGPDLGFRLTLILLIGFVFRFWALDIKPPHFDEGINGHFVTRMWKEGFYRYDPTNFHGPLYFYLLQIAEALFGKGIWGFRAVTGLISLVIVALVAMHRRFIGNAALWAALFVAVSPAFIFYSRYAIHESLFILGEVLFSYGFFLWRQEKSKAAASYMAAGFFSMFATKETFFIYFGTWAIAVFSIRIFEKIENRFFPNRKIFDEPIDSLQNTNLKATPEAKSFLISACVIGVILTLAIFSGFFTHLSGIQDMLRAFAFWTKTGVAHSGHEKAFTYWIQLLWKYEWPLFMAGALSPILYFNVGRTGKMLVLTGFGTWLAYSIIPYKTPWLILNFLWLYAIGLGLLISPPKAKGGKGSGFLRKFLVRGVVAIAAMIALGHTLYTSWRLNFRDYTKVGEPYVYVQSTKDFKNFMSILEQHILMRPEDLNMRLYILNKDPWPMPWTLSDFPNLHWGSAETVTPTNADVITVDESTREALEKKLTGKYFVFSFQVRDSYENGRAYFAVDKFKDVIPPGTTVFEKTKVEEEAKL